MYQGTKRPCNPPGFGTEIKSALLDYMLSRQQKLYRVSPEFYHIMVIGVENSSVSNLIVQIYTLSHISSSKRIYISYMYKFKT